MMLAAIFSISAPEAAIVAVLSVVTFAIGRRTQRPWMLGIPAMFAALSFVTPADPVSTLLTGIPVSVIYIAALLMTERRLQNSSL